MFAHDGINITWVIYLKPNIFAIIRLHVKSISSNLPQNGPCKANVYFCVKVTVKLNKAFDFRPFGSIRLRFVVWQVQHRWQQHTTTKHNSETHCSSIFCTLCNSYKVVSKQDYWRLTFGCRAFSRSSHSILMQFWSRYCRLIGRLHLFFSHQSGIKRHQTSRTLPDDLWSPPIQHC